MKRVYQASDITEAHIVAGMLQAHGIEAHVGGHYLQGGVGDLAALDFALVWVADEDIDAARSVIIEYENSDSSGASDHRPQPGRRGSRTGGAMLLALLALALLYWALTG